MTYLTDIPAVQDMAFCLGKEGCLFLTLCEIAERLTNKPIDVLRSARYCIDHNLLNYVDDNPTAHLKEAFYVTDRDKILAYLTGIDKITTLKTHQLSKKEQRPYFVRYSYKTGDKVSTHFALPDYDSLYKSITATHGTIDCYYIILLPKEA